MTPGLDGPGATLVQGLGVHGLGAHGLGEDLVSPDWPPLTLGELGPVLARLPSAGAAEAIVWQSPRPFAASAIVRGTRASVFVKRHAPTVRSVPDLAEEHAFIAHLRSRGAEIPALLTDVVGNSAVAGPGGTYEVHALADGQDSYRDAHSWTKVRSVSDAEALGHALGRLHLAAAGYDAPPRRTGLLVAGDALLRAPDLLGGLQARLATDGMLRDALLARPWRTDLGGALLGWHGKLQPHLAALAPLWVHGDFHASNLFWRDGRVSAVLDFGLCNRASAAYDLATAIERNTIAWLEPRPDRADAALALAILRGYDSARPRSAAEKAALIAILPIVHIDFALSELTYFNGVTHVAANADAAYGDFLLGHALWFSSWEGGAFLTALA